VPEPLEPGAGSASRIEFCADGGRVVVLADEDACVVEYGFDGSNRLRHVEERRPHSRLCIDYEHDEAHRLVREALNRFVREDLVQSTHAEHLYGEDGTIQNVLVTDAVGRRLEEKVYAPGGRLREHSHYDHTGRVSCRETYDYDDDGRLVRTHRRRVDSYFYPHPVWDSTELREYDDETGRLATRILIERRNVAEPGEAPFWWRIMEEVILYDPEQDGAPLRDETLYFDLGPNGEDIQRHRLLLNYHASDPDRTADVQVIEEDLRTGEVRERWSRSA
jgi:hypothetical protein